MKENYDSSCNNYFIGDAVMHKHTKLRGTIIEMNPLDKVKILWENQEEEWLRIYHEKGYNLGAIENVSKIIKFE